MIQYEWDALEGHPGQCCVHLYGSVSYRRLSPQFQFSLSGVTLVYLSQWSLLTGDMGGGGEEPNHTTARKPSPLSIIQYSLIVYILLTHFRRYQYYYNFLIVTTYLRLRESKRKTVFIINCFIFIFVCYCSAQCPFFHWFMQSPRLRIRFFIYGSGSEIQHF